VITGSRMMGATEILSEQTDRLVKMGKNNAPEFIAMNAVARAMSTLRREDSHTPTRRFRPRH
jgi:hypothetical protein